MFGEAKHLFLVRVLLSRKLTLPKTNMTIERKKTDVAPMKNGGCSVAMLVFGREDSWPVYWLTLRCTQ